MRSRHFLLLSTAAFFLLACNNAATIEVGADKPATGPTAANQPAVPRVNINTASEEELTGLPFIGTKLASDIVEFRSRYGPFRRPEQLMLVQGISEKRFRSIQNLIKTE